MSEVNYDLNQRDKDYIQNNKREVVLTKEQEEAVKGLIEFINSPYDAQKSVYGLTGPGGTGKTFITNQIINKCKLPAVVLQLIKLVEYLEML